MVSNVSHVPAAGWTFSAAFEMFPEGSVRITPLGNDPYRITLIGPNEWNPPEADPAGLPGPIDPKIGLVYRSRMSPTNTDIYLNFVYDPVDQAWYCTVTSIARLIGVRTKDSNDIAARVPAAQKRKYEVHFKSGGVSETWCVDEAGLEHILSTSRIAEAKAFLDWLNKLAAAKEAGTPLQTPLDPIPFNGACRWRP